MLRGTRTYLDSVAAARKIGGARAVSLARFSTRKATLVRVRDWCCNVCLGDPHLGQINSVLRARGLPQVPCRVTLSIDTEPDSGADKDNDSPSQAGNYSGNRCRTDGAKARIRRPGRGAIHY